MDAAMGSTRKKEHMRNCHEALGTPPRRSTADLSMTRENPRRAARRLSGATSSQNVKPQTPEPQDEKTSLFEASAMDEDEPPKTFDAPLLITRCEDGIIEFELDGNIYRVEDHLAFKELVAQAPEPTRSLDGLRRTQSIRREQNIAADTENAEPIGTELPQHQMPSKVAQPTANPLQRAFATAKTSTSTPKGSTAFPPPDLADELANEMVSLTS